jgi:hypothetical protein
MSPRQAIFAVERGRGLSLSSLDHRNVFPHFEAAEAVFADEPDLQGAGFFEQAGRDGQEALAAVGRS